jgi:hypothetical protein
MSKAKSIAWRIVILASFVLTLAAPFRWHG